MWRRRGGEARPGEGTFTGGMGEKRWILVSCKVGPSSIKHNMGNQKQPEEKPKENNGQPKETMEDHRKIQERLRET